MAEPDRTPRNLTDLATAFGEWTASRSAPDAIRTKTFPTVRKGFDPSEVSAYLERVAADMERLQNRIQQLESQAKATPQPVSVDRPTPVDDRFRAEVGHIAELMRRFDEDVRMMKVEAEAEVQAAIAAARAEADDIRREARLEREGAVADAAAIVAQAQADAQRLELDAQTRADEMDGAAQRALREARGQADELLRSITTNRQALIDDVRQMREQLVVTLARLDGVLAEREDNERLVILDEPQHDRDGATPH